MFNSLKVAVVCTQVRSDNFLYSYRLILLRYVCLILQERPVNQLEVIQTSGQYL